MSIAALLLFAVWAFGAAAGVWPVLPGPDTPAAAAAGGAQPGPEGDVRWATCNVEVWIPADGPAGLPAAAAAAAAEVSAAAGITFTPRMVAHTDADMAPEQPTVVLVAATHGAGPYRHPDAAAETKPVRVDGKVRLAERILVDPTWFDTAPADGPQSQVQLLVHELAHAAGAGHATSEGSTMAPDLGAAVGVTPDTAALLAGYAPAGCRPA